MKESLNRIIDWLAASPVRALLWIVVPALLWRLLTALWNIGYFAVDDYTLLSNSIPVQISEKLNSSLGALVTISDFRSPLPQALVHAVASLVYDFGGEHPLSQVRGVFVVMALLSLISMYFAWKLFALMGRPRQAVLALLLVSFHFLMPYLSTRSMIENMAAPFITASVYYLCVYYARDDRRALFVSVLILSFAALLRFQAGVLVLAYLPLFYWKRSWNDFFWFCGAGVLGLILTGLPDVLIKGVFHDSLIRYIVFNLNHASDFGTSPPWTYIGPTLAMLLPPAFFSRYKGFAWREQFGPLAPALIALVIFFISHSLIPHKEERFLVPMFPVALACLAPLADWLLRQPGRRWVLIYFAVLNTILLLGLTFFTFQHNIIGLVLLMERQPQIVRVKIFAYSLT